MSIFKDFQGPARALNYAAYIHSRSGDSLKAVESNNNLAHN